jgi:hypothetical protein
MPPTQGLPVAGLFGLKLLPVIHCSIRTVPLALPMMPPTIPTAAVSVIVPKTSLLNTFVLLLDVELACPMMPPTRELPVILALTVTFVIV